ncbi:MAG: hypothetical protein Ct9H300mP5_3300 [Candidatus Pelagibacterales bacterium]|nr:MAG: hypothetical protein Ct9H300mP5_3300 [Pelagibacterales bacterium]
MKFGEFITNRMFIEMIKGGSSPQIKTEPHKID